jgi:hypothetical protein
MEKILGEAGSLSKDPLFVPLEEKNSIETKLKKTIEEDFLRSHNSLL